MTASPKRIELDTPPIAPSVREIGHRTSLTADEARDLLRDTVDLLHPITGLVRDVIGGVSVLIEQDRDGLLHGRTDFEGEIRGWGGLTSMDRTQLRHLAAMARALHTCGDDGRKLGPSTYQSVAS